MARYLQEFFWTPEETVCWLKHVAPDLGLWIVLWEVGRDARLVGPDELSAKLLQSIAEDSVQFFLGDPELSGPVWGETGGQCLLDFQRSCAVQLVPPIVVSGRILLQGRLAILQLDQYDNPDCVARLPVLFRRLRQSMKNHSDHNRVVTQLLSGGGKKRWKDMLVGRDVPGAGIVQLKQFARGPVVFDVEAT